MGTSYSPPVNSDGTPDLARLQAEHRFLVEGLQVSTMPLAIYDDQGRIIVWNSAFENLFDKAVDQLRDKFAARQVTYEDVVRATNEGIVPDDELEELVATRVAEHGAEQGRILERHYPQHGWYRIHRSATPSGAVADIAININELKQREEAVGIAQQKADEERRRLENALESLEDGFAIYDANDRLRVFNSKFVEMHPQLADVLKPGESFESLVRIGIQRDIWDLDDEDPEEWLQNLMNQRRANDTFESIAKFQDGRWMRRLETKTPDGERVGIRSDITDAKMREFDLEEARADAESATRAKSEFLANMSHEIRTPMNGVLGMAELLSRTTLDEKQREFTDIIMKSGNALLTIINDVLDFSKIDAGQLQLNEQPTHLAEVVEDVATLVAATAAEQQVELITRVDPGLPQQVMADGGRIRQILINIVGNAVKFTKKGHVLVEVFGPIYGEVAEVTFKVQDTGIGIPEDSLDKIFESFNQVDSSATRKFEGTGLGLAICSRLVDLMGGKIGVESEEGKGSTFWFTVNLPIHGELPKRAAEPADITGARVLLVDDNDVNLSILKEQAGLWDLNVTAVSDGASAMMALWEGVQEETPFDLVILDYHMPQMDGAMVAQCIRNDVRLKGTKIIMLSSADGSVSNPEIGHLQLEGHLVKPVRSAVLFDTVSNVLSNERVRAPLHEPMPDGLPAVLTLADLVADAEADEPQTALPEPEREPEPEEQSEEILQEDAPSPAPAPDKEPTPSAAGEPIDIVVAEDNDINQIVFTQILQDTSYTFKIVGDGREAVEAYKAHMPKLILMDVSMPHMNGMDATQAIRTLEQHAGGHVPIVGVTANALRGDREKCLEGGMDDYLAKPVSPAMLKEKIAEWLDAQDEARTAG